MTNQFSDLPTYLTYDDVLLLPNYSEITPSKTDIATQLTENIQLDVPILASPMDTVCEAPMAIAIAQSGGYGIIHRNLSIDDQVSQLQQVVSAGLTCGAAVGIGSDFKDRVSALVGAGAREICIDSAHGHTKHVIEATAYIATTYHGVEVISGNVATYEGAKALFEAGASAVKVGMGPGSICTTRIMSGMGAPQLTAVAECVKAGKEYNRAIIADGGTRTSGDIVKALAAGARAVMVGSLLAGTDESPGDIVEREGKKFKRYRGMGSVGAMKAGSAARYGQNAGDEAKKLVPEGIESLVAYKGPAQDHLYQLAGGIRAGMAYLGAATLKELHQKARFVRISHASLAESKPHTVVEI